MREEAEAYVSDVSEQLQAVLCSILWKLFPAYLNRKGCHMNQAECDEPIKSSIRVLSNHCCDVILGTLCCSNDNFQISISSGMNNSACLFQRSPTKCTNETLFSAFDRNCSFVDLNIIPDSKCMVLAFRSLVLQR